MHDSPCFALKLPKNASAVYPLCASPSTETAARLAASRSARAQRQRQFGCKLARMEKIEIQQQGFLGFAWIGGWLFTIGFAHLTFWKGVLAIVLWPYYLGVLFHP
jgi:hypothetical protein